MNQTEILPVFYKTNKTGQGLPYQETLKRVIEKTKDKTRIYVFIGENVALLSLMQLLGDMHDRNQFNLDENIILAVDNSDDDMEEESECHKFLAPPWSDALSHIKSGSDTERLHQLYRSVLRIVPSVEAFRVKK